MGIIAKLYDLCIFHILESYALKHIPLFQTAYIRNRRGCEEHIFSLKVLSEIYSDLIYVITDFTKAFNTIPNIVIERCLDKISIPLGLKNCILDALSYFVTFDNITGHFSLHFRGVPQGGVLSGIIFIIVTISLSTCLQSVPIYKPVLVEDYKITHLLFADDCIIIARSTHDSVSLFRCLQSWSINNGLSLNTKKCKYMSNFKLPLPFSKVNKFTYLGITCSQLNNKLVLYRSHIHNNIISHKLSVVSHRLPNCSALRDVIKTFNCGTYGLFLTFSDTLRCANSVSDVVKKSHRYDSFMIKIVQDFTRCHSLFSVNRICTHLGLSPFRFGVQIIKAAAKFVRYLEFCPSNSISSICFRQCTNTSLALLNCNNRLIHQVHSLRSPNLLLESHWLNSRPPIRAMISRFFLCHDHADFPSVRIRILQLFSSREFAKLKEFLDLKISEL